MPTASQRTWRLLAAMVLAVAVGTTRGQLDQPAFTFVVDASTSMMQTPPGPDTTTSWTRHLVWAVPLALLLVILVLLMRRPGDEPDRNER